MAVEVTTTDLFVKIGKLIVQVDIQEQELFVLRELNRQLTEQVVALTPDPVPEKAPRKRK